MQKSGQAEILRAEQRDEIFLAKFHTAVTEILQGLLGIRRWLKLRKYIRPASELTYFGLTTLSNRQTLGEEYTGILQMHSSGMSLQSNYIKLLMILLNTCGENFLIYTLKKLEKHLISLPEDHPLQLHAREKMIRTVEYLQNIIPFVQRFHKAVFYLNGEYYQMGKRLTRTRYALVRPWLKDTSTLPIFRLLGIISFTHLMLHSFLAGLNLKTVVPKLGNSVSTEADESSSGPNGCPLCLNQRQNTSVIPCGHMFCWECIISWLQEQQECPLCRKLALPSRTIFLQNY